MSRELASSFSPADIEAALYEKWVAAGYFKADATSDKPAFTIVIPPPNVRHAHANEADERF